VIERVRRVSRDLDAPPGQHHRVLVARGLPAPVLQDLEVPARDGVHEAVLEQDDAVGLVLEERVTLRVREVDLLGLRGDDSR